MTHASDLQSMLDAARAGSGRLAAGWGQGRATYGGVVAGVMLAALRGRLEGASQGLPLRSMTVSFVAPATAGPADLDVSVLRAGSSVTQGQVTMRQDGAVVAVLLASLGAERASTVSVAPSAAYPVLPSPDETTALPHVPGVTPDFFAHVDLRLADGGMPYTTASTSHMLGWMRFREPTPTFGEEHFVSLVDAWPPAVIQMLAQPRPASSLTWTLELVEDVTAEPDEFWAYEVRTDHAGHGYGHTHAHVWRPDGTLVAFSRQTVTVFG